MKEPGRTLAYSDTLYWEHDGDWKQHKRGWNALFIDGHAKWIIDLGQELRDWQYAQPWNDWANGPGDVTYGYQSNFNSLHHQTMKMLQDLANRQ